MDALRTLSDVREKRLKDAQASVFIAHQRIEEKKQEIKLAQEERDAYEKELPELIRQLYMDIIGKKVDVPYVQEKVQLEAKLNQKKQDFVQKIAKLNTELDGCQEVLMAAQNELAKQERKKLAMQELIKEEAKKVKLAEERALSKVIDELANVRYVAKTC